MRTRQLRLNSITEIKKRLPQFIGNKINIVCTDGKVILAALTGFNETSLEAVNMRLKKINIPLSGVSEIYFDTKEC